MNKLEQSFKRHANMHTKDTLLMQLNNTIKFGRNNVKTFDSLDNMYVQKALQGNFEKLTKYQIVELKFYLRRAIDKARFGEDYEPLV